MKRTVLFLLALVLCFGMTGCGSLLGSDGDSSAALDGVTVTLTQAEIEKKKNGSALIRSVTEIYNGSDDNIMVVNYELVCYDRDGNELYSSKVSYNGQDKAIPPGETVEFQDGFQVKLEGTVKKLGVRIMQTKTTEELPPLHLPTAGEYLYEAIDDDKLNDILREPPVKLTVGFDQGGYLREAVFTEGEELTEALELFAAIKIGAETDIFVTDSYNYITFTWSDGSETNINMNGCNIEVSVYNNLHHYELEGRDEFWSYAYDFAEDAA